MLFIHTWEKVLGGEKTQTRRILKPGDVELVNPLPTDDVFSEDGKLYLKHPYYETREITAVKNGARYVYRVGHDYAVQPGRGKASIARIRITGIRREDVREISREDALAEGFENEADFLWTWCSMHDKPVWFRFDWKMVDWRLRIGRKQQGLVGWDTVIDTLRTRPNDRYQAWVIEFALVEGGAG